MINDELNEKQRRLEKKYKEVSRELSGREKVGDFLGSAAGISSIVAFLSVIGYAVTASGILVLFTTTPVASWAPFVHSAADLLGKLAIASGIAAGASAVTYLGNSVGVKKTKTKKDKVMQSIIKVENEKEQNAYEIQRSMQFGNEFSKEPLNSADIKRKSEELRRKKIEEFKELKEKLNNSFDDIEKEVQSSEINRK